MNPSYRIEYQPQLMEDAVLYAISSRPDKSLFRSERDQLYERNHDEDREQAFQQLHQRWFHRLELEGPLLQALEYWPILFASTHRCILTKARSPKTAGAELYVAPPQPSVSERERRTVVIQLTPELLAQSPQLLAFLRHELLHIVDMLDPNFGYEATLPKTTTGPAHDHFLQERYRVLWDMTIDGRLYQKGWLSHEVREKHLAKFERTFPGTKGELEKMFSFFFDTIPHTHCELVSFAQNPEAWLVGISPQASRNGRCALCHFPTFHLIDPNDLSPELFAKIQKEKPDWITAEPVCQQCVDLYEARTS
jgi:hypothetical protein